MYPQGVCRIRKPAYAGNGCAIFPVFGTEEWARKIRSRPQTIYSEVPKVSPAPAGETFAERKAALKRFSLQMLYIMLK